MLVFIFSFLLFVILLCALWFHDVWYPPEGRAEKKKWSRSLDRIEGGNKHNNQHACRAAPPIKPREASVVGISPVSRRKVIPMTISQQMILLFNQTREVGPNEYAHSLQEVTFENEAIERWLDDGGTEARRWQVHA